MVGAEAAASEKERAKVRAIWSGAISFGLVNVPIRMYSAIDEKDLRFHLLHVKDGSRIGYEKICKDEGERVPDDEITTAYEIVKGEYVYLDDDDFARAEGPLGRTIDLVDFVPYGEIDPIYFDRSYYLGPAEGAEKVYALLVTAMKNADLAGIATYVMRKKQHLGCLRVRDNVLTLSKMFFADEVRPTDEKHIVLSDAPALAAGTRVRVTDRRAGYAEVRTHGQIAWIPDRAILSLPRVD